ncbi:hypothetical protein PFISCL1PPCAC_8915, partial [Pristionchus fissidentatus]
QMRSVLFLVIPLATAINLPGSSVNVNSFDSVDTNKDGIVDWNEFEHWAGKKLHLKNDQRKNLFMSYDADRDNSLHIAEFVPLASAISQQPQLSKHDIFDRLDLNRDGVIDSSERSFSGVDALVINGLVQVADVNGDGLLSRDEFDRATDQQRVKTQVRESITPERGRHMIPNEEKDRELAVQLVQDMDTNKDGRLALAELATFASKFAKVSSADIAAAFSQLDLNRDGFVDVNELARVPSKISAIIGFQAPPPVRNDFARMPPLRF